MPALYWGRIQVWGVERWHLSCVRGIAHCRSLLKSIQLWVDLWSSFIDWLRQGLAQWSRLVSDSLHSCLSLHRCARIVKITGGISLALVLQSFLLANRLTLIQLESGSSFVAVLCPHVNKASSGRWQESEDSVHAFWLEFSPWVVWLTEHEWGKACVESLQKWALHL